MKNLKELRKEVDGIDSEIIALMSKRFAATNEIGNLKKAKRMKIYDSEREAKIAKRWKSEGRLRGLDSRMLMPILDGVLSFSKRRQKVMKDKKSIVILGTGNMAEALGTLSLDSGHSVYVTGRRQKGFPSRLGPFCLRKTR